MLLRLAWCNTCVCLNFCVASNRGIFTPDPRCGCRRALDWPRMIQRPLPRLGWHGWGCSVGFVSVDFDCVFLGVDILRLRQSMIHIFRPCLQRAHLPFTFRSGKPLHCASWVFQQPPVEGLMPLAMESLCSLQKRFLVEDTLEVKLFRSSVPDIDFFIVRPGICQTHCSTPL